ncbi:MAG: hypothetical protein ACOZCP_02005 [Pseudomonadota bacterium]
MPERANQRLAADLGDYPDLVVIYLGFRATGMHQTWWRQFNRDTRGAQFWHELYRLKGGMEGIISHLDHHPGFWAFAGERPAQRAWTTARGGLGACPMDADRRAA